MSLPPEIRARWLANLRAAGIEPDEGTLGRVEPGLAERVEALYELLGRLDHRSENPDYLRDTVGVGEEQSSDDA